MNSSVGMRCARPYGKPTISSPHTGDGNDGEDAFADAAGTDETRENAAGSDATAQHRKYMRGAFRRHLIVEQELTMSMHDHSHSECETPHTSFLTSRAGLVFIGFAIIAGALLFTEHRAHVLGLLIWLPLLACPLMHIFMHHGHGGQGGNSQPGDERKTP